MGNMMMSSYFHSYCEHSSGAIKLATFSQVSHKSEREEKILQPDTLQVQLAPLLLY